MDNLIIIGRKAVLDALKNDQPIDRILLRSEKVSDKRIRPGIENIEGTLRLIAARAREKGVVVQETDRKKLDELTENGHHQGVIALCPAVPYVEINDILHIAKKRNEQPFVLILDGVTDPHNLGAVLRSAEAGGVHGVIIPKRRAVGLNSTVAKTSAGAITHMAIARVNNISRAIEELKSKGLWIACSDTKGDTMYDTDFNCPLAIVLGSEDEGVSRLVSEKCDFHVKIPMLGIMTSLNVSVSAGILIYEVVRQRL